ncbi:hypothetical protein PISMIDRAFT_11510 [Pisolithus microcarpus 441]|uniref:Uncharacterized protein n=1 Tax=Pisolithus microcarpus 441 TaxID=765257 RepID=A0A0C9ZSC9_9AGAM|nr:hypothetical protein PISMIDRAFT_11510 [Pisolithus microcarpus 441]
MSTSKATTSHQPIYIPPDTICKEIPKRQAKNMEALAAVMREILDKAAEEDVAQEWMERFEEVLGQIEGLRTFAANMGTEVPRYPEETEEVISSSFMMLVGKTAQLPSSSALVGSKVRHSCQQQEKAAMVDEGSKGTSHATNLVAVKAAAASAHEALAVKQEQAAVIDNSTSMMQGLRSGRGIQCMWKGGVACEACHIGKKKCNKAGKLGRKCKNPDVPPASSASTSKRARMTPVPPPSSSAPPKATLKVRPQVISQPAPAAGAPPSLPMPQGIPSVSVSTLPGVLLFPPVV